MAALARRSYAAPTGSSTTTRVQPVLKVPGTIFYMSVPSFSSLAPWDPESLHLHAGMCSNKLSPQATGPAGEAALIQILEQSLLVTYRCPEHTMTQIGGCSEPKQVCSQVPWYTPGSHQQPGLASAGPLNTAQARTTLISASLKPTTMCSFGCGMTAPQGPRPSLRMQLCPAGGRADQWSGMSGVAGCHCKAS